MANASQRHVKALEFAEHLCSLAQDAAGKPEDVREIEKHKRALVHLRRMCLYVISNRRFTFEDMAEAQLV